MPNWPNKWLSILAETHGGRGIKGGGTGNQPSNGFGCSTFLRGIEIYFGSFDVE